MWLKKSKEKLVYQQVSDGGSGVIRSLHREGASLEWMDRKGRTPLIMACRKRELYDVAKTLIELGANINAYLPARNAGTPLHHAAKKGLVRTVELLLSHGANPLARNDDGQKPLDIARDKGFSNVVGVIERHICLFSGWMRQFYGPAFSPRSDRVWVVVLPIGSRNPAEPLKLEVAVYTRFEDAEPRKIIPLWLSNMEEPITNQSGIEVSIIRTYHICDSGAVTQERFRLGPSIEGGEQQLKWFCDACKGIPQTTHTPKFLQSALSAPQLMSETPTLNHQSIGEASSSTAPPPPPSSWKANTLGLNSHERVIVHKPSPSAPPLTDDDDVQTLKESPIHYPIIDSTPVDVPYSSPPPASAEGEKNEDRSSGQCSICLDAPSDAVCVPCGHLAGCMSCLTEIKSKNWGCPVCRAKIDQIVKLYRV
ncbi:Ankyrin repeat-containing protein [Hirschfeldia incana]|nr:Ankyrin repeat-containing protein [Hirschfeldia incana]